MDEADRASRLTEIENEVSVAKIRKELQVPVNETGLCCDCGIDIEPRRLEAYPTAKRCLGCQQEYELVSKRYV